MVQFCKLQSSALSLVLMADSLDKDLESVFQTKWKYFLQQTRTNIYWIQLNKTVLLEILPTFSNII